MGKQTGSIATPMKETSEEKRKGVRITLLLEVEDAHRLETAFQKGELADLGILKVSRLPEAELRRWTSAESAKRSKKTDVSGPGC